MAKVEPKLRQQLKFVFKKNLQSIWNLPSMKICNHFEICIQWKFAITWKFVFKKNLQSIWYLPSMKIYNHFEICLQWKFTINLKFAFNENLQSLWNLPSMKIYNHFATNFQLLASNSVKAAQILLKVDSEGKFIVQVLTNSPNQS